MTYIKGKDLGAMNRNMEKLIEILNHRVTKLEIHVGWLKRLMGYIAALLSAIAVAVLGMFLKIMLGGV